MTENEMIDKMACAVCKAVFNKGKCISCSHYEESKRMARILLANGCRIVENGAVVLTAEELALYETNYDKVYEQAKADIIGNMADGGTSCHWCMDEHYQRGRKDAGREILSWLRAEIQHQQFNYTVGLGILEQMIAYKAKECGVDLEVER